MKSKTHGISKLDERKLVVKAAVKASSTAIRVSKALKLPVQSVKGKNIVMQEADGRVTKIRAVQQVKSNVVLSKGMKICLPSKG